MKAGLRRIREKGRRKKCLMGRKEEDGISKGENNIVTGYY